MFRVSTDDISDEEFTNIVSPFMDKCDCYMEELMVDYVCYYISSGFKSSSIWCNSYDTHINSALDAFTNEPRDYSKFKEKVTKMLSDKYGLVVASDDPLSFK